MKRPSSFDDLRRHVVNTHIEDQQAHVGSPYYGVKVWESAVKEIQLNAERSGYERGVREARLNWSTGDVKPERGNFSSEYFLCVNLSGNPIVCVYDWETLDAFTIGGGDTQKVLWWTPLKSILSLLTKKEQP